MKKTLAAVLAAAMALSTATVAFATDYESEFGEVSGSVDTGKVIRGEMGKSVSYIITDVTDIERDNEITGTEMAEAIKNGYVTTSVIVTRNKNVLSGIPSLRVGDVVVRNHDATEKVTKYTWRSAFDTNPANHNLATITEDWPAAVKKTVGKDKEVTAVCLYAINGVIQSSGRLAASLADSTDIANGEFVILKKGDPEFDFYVNDLAVQKLADGSYAGWFNKTYKDTEALFPELKIGFNHTYGTKEVEADLRLRFTVKKLPKDASGLTLGSKEYSKGDTITTEIVTAKAKYYDMDNLHTDMQLTLDERDVRKVLLNGADLYNEIGNDDFTVTFADDIAMFSGKSTSNQKTVNLWYNIDDDDTGLADAYPAVDFTFIDFPGDPAFQKTGSLVFAAKDKNTTVYEWDGEYWNPVSDSTTYDPTYKTVTVKNVKKLGKYAIASEVLPVEEEPEEPAEPVDSTPVAEPDNDEGGNPNTGAC